MKMMAGWVIALAVGGVGSVGTLIGCSEGAKDAAQPRAVGRVQGAITVADTASLPNCNPSNRGGVYFVTSDSSLLYCDGRNYRPVDTTGLRGRDGANGKDGANGRDATTWLVTTAIATADECTTGGVTIRIGPDANHDSVIDAVTSTTRICNGRDGTNGTNGVDGTNGTNGTNGESGHNSLIAMTDEPAGQNCASGGTKISVGLDTNNDGTLDASEVTGTKFACTGVATASMRAGAKVVGVMWVDGLTGPETTPGVEGAFDLNEVSLTVPPPDPRVGPTTGNIDLAVTIDPVMADDFSANLGQRHAVTLVLFLADETGALPSPSNADSAFIGLRFSGGVENTQALVDGTQRLTFASGTFEYGGSSANNHARKDFTRAGTFPPRSDFTRAGLFVREFDRTPALGATRLPVVLIDDPSKPAVQRSTVALVTTPRTILVDGGPDIVPEIQSLSVERRAGEGALDDLEGLLGPGRALVLESVTAGTTTDFTVSLPMMMQWSISTASGHLRERVEFDGSRNSSLTWTKSTAP